MSGNPGDNRAHKDVVTFITECRIKNSTKASSHALQFVNGSLIINETSGSG